MHIYTETTGSGKDVVLLHGWGCNHHHMRPLAEHLAKHFRVTNVNLPGCGKSDWVDIETMHDIADRTLTALPKKAIYIGWSFGGAVSASIAARYPERVERFIGITTSPKFIEDDGWPGVPKPGFKAGFNANNMDDFKNVLRNFIDSEFANINPKPESFYRLDKINQKTEERDLKNFKKGVDISDDLDFRDEYSKIKCPIDLILGEKDDCVPQATISLIKALNKNIKIHTIPNAQHMAFWTHPKQFYEVLDDILFKE